MSKTKESLVGVFWAGWCPVCSKVEMVVNRADFFECPECHLQAGSDIAILSEKGAGNFVIRNDSKIFAPDVLEVWRAGEILIDARV